MVIAASVCKTDCPQRQCEFKSRPMHHPPSSPTGRRRLSQEQDSVSSNLTLGTILRRHSPTRQRQHVENVSSISSNLIDATSAAVVQRQRQ